jgi:hypothetical protein
LAVKHIPHCIVTFKTYYAVAGKIICHSILKFCIAQGGITVPTTCANIRQQLPLAEIYCILLNLNEHQQDKFSDFWPLLPSMLTAMALSKLSLVLLIVAFVCAIALARPQDEVCRGFI